MGIKVIMISRSALSEQISNVQSLGDEAVREAQSGADNKMRLIQLRRLIAVGVNDLVATAENAIAQLPPEQRGDIDIEFRRLVDAARRAVANHLANWPAMSIDKDKASYAKSAAEVARNYSNFVNWTSSELLSKLSA
jgi:hypothetical protein